MDSDQIGILRKPTAFRNSLIVLSSQYSTGERGPYRSAHKLILEKMAIRELKLVSGIKVVLRLLSNRLIQSVFLADEMCLSDILGIPLTCPPVVSVPFPDKPVESTASFFHRGLIIWTMAEHDIDIVQLHFLKGVLHSFDNVLS